MALRLGRTGLWLLVAVALLWATSAAAEVQYSMTGKWGSRKGAIARAPLAGNVACTTDHIIGLNAGLFGTATPFPPPAAQPLQIPSNPGIGCIAATTTATSTMGVGGARVTKPRTANGGVASAPASFTVPTSAFFLPSPTVKNVTPIPNVPVVLQFGSQAQVNGPVSPPITPISSTVGAPAAQWRQFRQSAWMTQTGRPGPDFTACWGAAGGPPGVVGACTNINQGTRPLLVKYRGSGVGQNFGGTMSLLFNNQVNGPSTLAIVNRPSLPPGGIAIKRNFGLTSGPGGRGYRAAQVATAGSVMIHTGYGTTIATTIGGATAPVWTSLGFTVATVPGTLASFQFFPLTVGSVLARNTGGTAGGNPLTVTLSAKGSDSRTQWGQGRIQMVAGGLIASSGNSPDVENVSLEFVPEPGTTMLLAAGGLYLVGISRLRKQRR